MLNIQVRVASQQALAALKSVQAATASIGNAGGAAGGKVANGLNRGLQAMGKFGKDLQWTGRQLEYNFTLPLALAGGAAVKWSMDNEKAMVRVRKVYGDLSMDSATLKAETDALAKSFELLSSRFGVHQDEVIGIGAAWAQAGASGVALANATRLTLEAMIIGEMDATAATEGLLAVQSAYRLGTVKTAEDVLTLGEAMAQMNIIENQTSISFAGLIDVITRAGGSARTAGIDIRHLSAMAATLVPAGGTAAQAGNSLRTMISRLMVPTREAADVMEKMGINVMDASWQMLNGTERMEKMAVSFDGLTQSQKNTVSAFVASRWQINRFDLLMEDMAAGLDEATKGQSTYAKALAATADQAKANATYAQELTTVLSSQPQAFAILWNVIRNGMVTAIGPLIPVLVGLMARVAQLVQGFTKLDPAVQQLILGFLVLLALIGPITKYLGAFVMLFKTIGGAAVHLAGLLKLVFSGLFSILLWPFRMMGLFVINTIFPAILSAATTLVSSLAGIFTAFSGGLMSGLAAIPAAIVSGIGAVPLAIGAALVVFGLIFRKQIGDMIQWVIRAFNSLPPAILRPMTAVLNGIKAIVLKIREWLSYINPFARHSPSLVDNVTRGMQTILDQYARLRGIGPMVRAAADAQKYFAQATAQAMAALQGAGYADDREKILAYAPQAAGAVDNLIANIWRLRGALDAVGAEIESQKSLVISLGASLEAAMAPWNKAITENEIAQKKLRLEILQMEAAGQSIDDIKDKYSQLNGQIELLAGQKEDLRLAGAGSDILQQYTDEIAGLEAQRNAMEGQGTAVNELEKALEELRRQGEILDLQKALLFDPQLEALAAQEQKLDQLEAAYSDIESQINDMEQAMSSFASEAQSALAKLKELKDTGGDQSMAAQLFDAGASGDFAVPGGDAIPGLGREGGLPEIEKFNEDLQKELDEALKSMGDLDLFAPFREMWDNAWKWVEDNIWPHLANVWTKITDWWNGLSLGEGGGILGAIGSALSGLWEWLKNSPIGTFFEGIGSVVGVVGGVILKFWDAVKPAFEWFGEQLGKIFEFIGEQWTKWQPTFDKAGEAFGHIFNVIGIALKAVAGVFYVILSGMLEVWEWVWGALEPILTPIFDGILRFIGIILDILRNTINFVLDLINGDFGKAFGDLWNIVKSHWDLIYNIFETAIKLVIGIVRGMWDAIWEVMDGPVSAIINGVKWLVEQVVKFFTWLWDVLVGHSIIPDLVNGIAEWFAKLAAIAKFIWDVIAAVISFVWNNIVKPIWDAIKWYIDSVLIPAFTFLWQMIQVAWDVIQNVISFAWNNIIMPIWDLIVWYIETILIPGFKFLWAAIQIAWDIIQNVISFAWDKIIKPIWDAIWAFIEKILIPGFKILWNIISFVWESVVKVIQWAWNNVIKPIWDTIWNFITTKLIPAFQWLWDKVQTVWNGIKSAIETAWGIVSGIWITMWSFLQTLIATFQGLWDKVKSVFDSIKNHATNIFKDVGDIIKSGINVGINAVNTLIDGLNKVAELLPGLDWHIDHIPTLMAQGGQIPSSKVNDGFVTNGARAIVGEGNPRHPEYVIPTDPKYRNRAYGLWQQLSRSLGIPAFASGGMLPDATGVPHTGGVLDGLKSIGGAIINGVRKGAAMALFGPLNNVAEGMINGIPWDWARDRLNGVRQAMYDWVKGEDDKQPTGGPGMGWEAQWEIIKNQFPWAHLFSSVRPGAITVNGNRSDHADGRAIDIDPSMEIFDWIAQTFPDAKSLIFSPAGGRQIRNGQQMTYTGAVRDTHWDHVHWAMAQGGKIPLEELALAYNKASGEYEEYARGGMLKLARGGAIVGRHPGGVMALLGEGRTDEKVQVTPLNGKDDSGKREFNFYGDLSFPNITNAGDAKEFLRNLEDLVSD